MLWGNPEANSTSHSVSGSNDWSGNFSFSNFQGPPNLETAAEFHGKKNLVLSAPISAVGGGTLTYAASGLPDGLTLNVVTGEITGAPIARQVA